MQTLEMRVTVDLEAELLDCMEELDDVVAVDVAFDGGIPFEECIDDPYLSAAYFPDDQ